MYSGSVALQLHCCLHEIRQSSVLHYMCVPTSSKPDMFQLSFIVAEYVRFAVSVFADIYIKIASGTLSVDLNHQMDSASKDHCVGAEA